MQGDNLDKLTIARTAKETRVKKRFKTSQLILLIVIVAALVSAILWLFLSKGYEVRVASVSEVYPAQVLSKLNASGYVVAQRKADVAAKITGQLIAVIVKEGSIVKEGQVIARLENSDAKAFAEQARANMALAKARVAQAKADLDNVSLDFGRKKNLVGTGVISRADFDAAQARYLGSRASYEAAQAELKASEAALKNAEVTLSYSEIKAPFDAVVLTKNADVGDIITPLGAAAKAKSAVVSIADLSSLQVEADVSEGNLSMVSAGQPCDVALDALPGVRFKGVVDTIVPTVDRSKATVLVKIRFLQKDTRILPEMSAKVAFLSQELKPEELKPITMVNSSTLVRSGKSVFAYRIKNEKAYRTKVRTGRTINDMVEVLGGLGKGDTVVVSPPKGLRDGSKITVLQQ
jgi:RND family efflux transporter MFP subunit